MQVRSELWKRCLVLLLAGIFCIAMLAGCSNGENSDAADPGTEAESAAETADNEEESEDAEAAADSSESEEAEIVDIEPVDPDEFQSILDKAEPYEGEVQMSVQSVSREEVPDGEEPDSDVIINKNSYNLNYLPISAAGATSTLQESGYYHSVWNMLDWDLYTCWAEGNPNSEGTMEAFEYRFNGVTRIDGFTIFPGYQKSSRTYRNNIVPTMLVIEAGGYEIPVNLEPQLMDLPNDDDCYWIDCAFRTPIYADYMYVMIGAVKAYSNNPYYDCCISEFHPFRF